MSYKILFNRPGLRGNEIPYMRQAIDQGHISGDGVFTRRCHALLEEAIGTQKALLTTSCTQALEMSALLLDIKNGDEVILPSFTFVSTANAFVLRGAHPVFVDVRPDTLNLDEALLEQAITPRTRAIVVVHYAGVGCEMNAIMEISERHNLTVIEDNAHGLFGKYENQNLGTFGVMAAQSFHETKNFSCGEGGALLINDASIVERAEIIREKGTDRSRFFRGQVDKYSWVDVGSSFLPSDLLAAFLLSQLEDREQVQAERRKIWDYYYEHLQDWADSQGAQLPTVPDNCEQTYHMFYLLLPSLSARTAFIQHLKADGIMSVFHYLPLHLSKMGLKFGGQVGDCPVTEDVSDRLVRLPFFNTLSTTDLEQVVESAIRFNS